MAACDKRQKDRSPLNTRGVAVRQGLCLAFTMVDVSLSGTCVEIQEDNAPEVGTAFRIHLLTPGFNAKAVVRWVHTRRNGSTLIGFQFIAMDFLNAPPPNQMMRPTYYA